MWDPDSYGTTIHAEIHDYDELQEQITVATRDLRAESILDLGTGTGATAARVLQVHPGARLVGIDSSAGMLRAAAAALPGDRVDLLQQDLSAPLPDQTFDLVVSGLAIHHLDGEAKAKLFADVAQRLRPGGRFVLGDVVVPDDPARALIEIEPGYDFPSTLDDHLRWMEDAGLSGEVVWLREDLAVFRAEAAAV